MAGVTATGETINNANQGATVTFTNTITNNGNSSDVFNINIVSNSFPAGTSYIVYKADGFSPLLDTNNDGTMDTGPLGVGSTYTAIVKATLPGTTSGGGPYQLTFNAVSINDPGVSDTFDDILTTITGSTVDITEGVAIPTATTGDGLGSGAEGSPVETNTMNPGATTIFTLFINNTAATSDNYDLSISTVSNFSSIQIPAGVNVTFKNQGGSVIANTGTILAGVNKQITVEITVPANSEATTSPDSYYVRAKSPASSATDIIHLGVTINTIRDVTIAPNNSGQLYPGGSVTYAHTITNNGNVTENLNGTELTLAMSDNNTGFSSVAYLDTNGDGVIDTGESLIGPSTDLGLLAPGGTVKIVVKVTASPGVTEGLSNTTTTTLTLTGTINSVAAPAISPATDITTVINSNVALVKRQSIDVDGNGVADGGYVSSNINAKPGEGVVYQITIQNLGTDQVENVTVNDAIPPYTTYNNTVPVNSTVGTATYDSGAGTINVDIGTLAPGQIAVITFGVVLNN